MLSALGRITIILLSTLLMISAAWADHASLLDYVESVEGQQALDQTTRAQRTMNRVELLHLGKRSKPKRIELIQEADDFLYTVASLWFDDEEGQEMRDHILEKHRHSLETNELIDIKVLWDYFTAVGSDGFSVQRDFEKQLKKSFALWNKVEWLRTWSALILDNRLHDKMLIADGERLIMGGMNVGNDYMRGGTDPRGWHDTDVYIEGPAAREATKLFARYWELKKYFSNPLNPFPITFTEQAKLLQQLYYEDREEVEITIDGLGLITKTLRFPLDAYLPDMSNFDYLADSDDLVPVRLIYDSPFVNRDPKTKKLFSNTINTLELLFSKAKERVRIFVPYLSITKKYERILRKTAERGIDVQIITNSQDSHDMGGLSYLGALSVYEPLLRSGVRIFEWQGHRDLLNLEIDNFCDIRFTGEKGFLNEWPGQTMHTKAVIIDGQVSMIGSNNMNRRSELENSETMALISDEGFSAELEGVFDSARMPASEDVLCHVPEYLDPRGIDLVFGLPPKVREVSLEAFLKMKEETGLDFSLIKHLKIYM